MPASASGEPLGSIKPGAPARFGEAVVSPALCGMFELAPLQLLWFSTEVDAPRYALLYVPVKMLFATVTCALPDGRTLIASEAFWNWKVFEAITKSTVGAAPCGSAW